MQEIAYLNLESGFVGAVSAEGFERFSERHYAALKPKPLTSADAEGLKASPDRDVVLGLSKGLPGPDEIAFSAKALAANRKVYLHWPAENAVEVVTTERLLSFRRHHRVVNLFRMWAGLRLDIANWKMRASHAARRLSSGLRARAVPVGRALLTPAAPVPDAARFGFLKLEGDRYKVEGRGLYFRLDYWAKLKGGGSYGHTCYQVKALNKASSEPMHCILASHYALLDDFGVHQIVVPAKTGLADEFSLVDNGEAYAGVVEEMLKLYKPQFVFERLVLGSAVVARACRRAGVPYIAEFNGSELTMSKVFGGREMNNAATLQAIEKEAFDLADIISVVSEPVKDAVVALGVPASKILVNPNGVDLDSYHPLPSAERSALRAELGFSPDDVVLGFCGTFGGWHGIEVLAEALPEICRARPNARFLLIGDGGFKHLVTEAVDREDLSAQVKDMGLVAQTEAARLLAACDIFLSPHSKNMGDKPFFGSPTKLFEYMAYGAGIVCSDLVQLGEVMRPAAMLKDRGGAIREDARSVLIEPASAQALVEASLWLIDDPALRARLGRNAMKAAAEYYTWDAHVQSLWRFALGEELGGYHKDRGQL
ncbi:MAG: glycosyltransferase family 4 protein [Pseudomonadota bacterium]|nr:glycosyltransferase family 4 protein [Pseudomonadota bacterium]